MTGDMWANFWRPDKLCFTGNKAEAVRRHPKVQHHGGLMETHDRYSSCVGWVIKKALSVVSIIGGQRLPMPDKSVV